MTGRRILLAALVIMALGILLAACDPYAGKVVQPPLVNKALNEVPVIATPHFVQRGDIPRNCLPGQGACTKFRVTDTLRFADVYVVEPEDFNDYDRLADLGHECWHAFGARHKEPR